MRRPEGEKMSWNALVLSGAPCKHTVCCQPLDCRLRARLQSAVAPRRPAST